MFKTARSVLYQKWVGRYTNSNLNEIFIMKLYYYRIKKYFGIEKNFILSTGVPKYL